MKRVMITAAMVMIPTVMIPAALFAGDDRRSNWPSFRGPGASGITGGGAAPIVWDGETGKNILWRTEIPGLGHSSPVIWEDRIFLTTAVSDRKNPRLRIGLYGDIDPVNDGKVQEWRLYSIDRKTGAIAWMRKVHEGVPKIKRHPKSTHANSTPATDGRHVVAFFGSEGLYCYDMNGRLLWKKDLGVLDSAFFRAPEAQWGFGSSPIIHDGKVIVQCDVLENSFIAVFDVATGEELWRTRRDEVPTWSTPAIDAADGATRVVVNGYRHIGGYDLATGKEIWRMEGGGDIPVPTPVIAGDLTYITNAHGGEAPIYAIRRDATGDIETGGDGAPSPHIAWSRSRDGAYMQTPLVYRDALYVCRDNGALASFDAVTGEQRYRTRLGRGGSGFTASAVASGGRIYYTSEVCDTYVVAAGPEFKLLETNALDAICMATPAIADGTLYVRTNKQLIAIASQGEAGSASTRGNRASDSSRGRR